MKKTSNGFNVRGLGTNPKADNLFHERNETFLGTNNFIIITSKTFIIVTVTELSKSLHRSPWRTVNLSSGLCKTYLNRIHQHSAINITGVHHYLRRDLKESCNFITRYNTKHSWSKIITMGVFEDTVCFVLGSKRFICLILDITEAPPMHYRPRHVMDMVSLSNHVRSRFVDGGSWINGGNMYVLSKLLMCSLNK